MQNASVLANIKKNRLHIKLKGNLSANDVEKLYTEVRFSVADLSPGFDVITDMTACSVGALTGLPTLRKIMHYLVANKMGRVVRVLDRRKVIFQQLLNFLGTSQGYEDVQVGSLDEAEEILSRADCRHTMRIRLYDQLVQFISEKVKGDGQIEDLSLTGCKIVSTTVLPTKGETLDIKIPFEQHENLLHLFDGKAEVIWADGETFGVNFIEVRSHLKDQLWDRLVYESTLNKK